MKHQTPEVIILSGMSGSGKSSALNTLEDAGYFAVDNLPGALFLPLMETLKNRKANPHLQKLAITMDARERTFVRHFPNSLKTLRSRGIFFRVLFFDARDDILLRRFSETRRRHPLSPNGRALTGIRQERDLLQSVREVANHVIDTSYMNVHALREEVLSIVRGRKTKDELSVTLISFGYRFGIPLESDLVLDVRFLPNPHFIPSLRRFSGLDTRVARFVLDKRETKTFLRTIRTLLKLLLRQYLKEGKVYLNIAFGCTGGRHRSVALSEKVAEDLKRLGYPVKIQHRDIRRE